MKKILLFLFIVIVIAGGLVYHYRFDLFQMSAEAVIKEMLPDYVDAESIVFNLEKGTMEVTGFGIKNPREFTNKYLAHIDSIYCEYKMKGDNLLDGINITKIEARSPVITIERLRNGKVNVNSMSEVITPPKKLSEVVSPRELPKPKSESQVFNPEYFSDFLTLTDKISVQDGKILFIDHHMGPRTLSYTFADVYGTIILDLSSDYTEVKELETFGRGFVNSDPSQRIEWAIKYYPLNSPLRMSNRFDVYGVEVTQFRPYYDIYSPIDFRSGRMSGSLVFDFDNGNIGSTNTVTFQNLTFSPKPGSVAAQYWAIGAGDIVNYLKSRSGDIYFDFKIKGSMTAPRFYPGPIVKDAIQRLAIDKISEIVQQVQGGGQEGQAAAASGGGGSDADKIIDIMKELLQKQ